MASIAKDANNNSNNNNKIVEQHHKDLNNMVEIYENQTNGEIKYKQFVDESEMPAIRELIARDLSEPYSIYTYRYFINNWPNLCWLAYADEKLVGVVISKADNHRGKRLRGYIAMLAVDSNFRKRRIGTNLVCLTIKGMEIMKCDECVLEALINNHGALRLYGSLGFVRAKRLPKYYLNGLDAYRLKLYLQDPLVEYQKLITPTGEPES
jgi:N-alpha-acetyltransferase 30